ncbi:hypothetical protein Misp01_74020 [Microtetraspora sp. NBRC 13810]|nr:hypothetical protein Misp01_74020 [Microtetraspora sp. NBRC 13810]
MILGGLAAFELKSADDHASALTLAREDALRGSNGLTPGLPRNTLLGFRTSNGKAPLGRSPLPGAATAGGPVSALRVDAPSASEGRTADPVICCGRTSGT